jgi:hypothetical protein
MDELINEMYKTIDEAQNSGLRLEDVKNILRA